MYETTGFLHFFIPMVPSPIASSSSSSSCELQGPLFAQQEFLLDPSWLSAESSQLETWSSVTRRSPLLQREPPLVSGFSSRLSAGGRSLSIQTRLQTFLRLQTRTCTNMLHHTSNIQFSSIQLYLYSIYYNTNCLEALFRDPEADPPANTINY